MACLSGFRDLERCRLRDSIIRGGGAVSDRGLAANCTHLIVRELRGAKCRKALDALPDVRIVSALWVTRSVSHGRRENEVDYCARPQLASLLLSNVDIGSLCQHGQLFFTSMRFFVEDPGNIEAHVLDLVKLHGGLVVTDIKDATHVLADTAEPDSVLSSSQVPAPARRTSAWVAECVRLRTTVWPSKALEWKGWQFQPSPGALLSGAYFGRPIVPVDGSSKFIITLTGYTGIMRDTLKSLIQMAGAECTPPLTKNNTHLVCNTPTSKKANAASAWGVKVVNHLWIMDSILTWTWQNHENYSRPGEEILADEVWTLLDEQTLDSNTIFPHPRFLMEHTWPLPCATNSDDAVAETQESGTEGGEPALKGQCSNADEFEETQSSQGCSAGQAGVQMEDASVPAAVSGDKTCLDASPFNASVFGNGAEKSSAGNHQDDAPATPWTVNSNAGGAACTTHREHRDSNQATLITGNHEIDAVEPPRALQSELTKPSPVLGPPDSPAVAEPPRKSGVVQKERVSPGLSAGAIAFDDMDGATEENLEQAQAEKSDAFNDDHNQRAFVVSASQAASAVLCDMKRADFAAGRAMQHVPQLEEEGEDSHEIQEHHRGQRTLRTASSPTDQGKQANKQGPRRRGRESNAGTGSPSVKHAGSGPNLAESQGSISTASRGVRCLATSAEEFQYDFDDSSQRSEGAGFDAGSAASPESSRGGSKPSSPPRAKSHSLSPDFSQGSRAFNPASGIHAHDGKAEISAPVPSAPGSDEKGRSRSLSKNPSSHAARPAVVTPNDEEAVEAADTAGPVLAGSRTSSQPSHRVNAHQQAGDLMDNIMAGQYESMVFGHYENETVHSPRLASPDLMKADGAGRTDPGPGRASGGLKDGKPAASSTDNAGKVPSTSGAGKTRGAGKRSSAQVQAQVQSSTGQEGSGWQCEKCTLLNAERKRKCGACGSAKSECLRGNPALESRIAGEAATGAATAAGQDNNVKAKSAVAAGQDNDAGQDNNVKAKSAPRKRSGKTSELDAPALSKDKHPKVASASTTASNSSAAAIRSGTAGAGAANSSSPAYDSSAQGGRGRVLGMRRVSASKDVDKDGAASMAGAPLGKRSAAASSTNEQPPSKSARASNDCARKASALAEEASPAEQRVGRNVLSGTRSSRARFVLVCGRTAEREDQAAAVRRLGGQSAYVHDFLPQATHIIVKELRRTEKFLCACAAGRWILKPSYLESCKANNAWLQEQSFEWNNTRKIDKDQKYLWHGAPRRWRQHWEQFHVGPFAQFKCLLLPETHPPPDVLDKIISAGSGRVVRQDQTPTLAAVQRQVAAGVTHIVCETLDSAISKWLDVNKIPYFKGEYIMDLLALKSRPSQNDPLYRPEREDVSSKAGGGGRGGRARR